MAKIILVFMFLISTSWAAEHEFDGWARMRSISFYNYDMDDDKHDPVDLTGYRIQWGIKSTLDAKTHTYIQPRFAKFSGQRNGTTNSSGAAGDKATGLNDVDFHQAYFVHDIGDWQLKIGRQELNYGEHLIVGSLPWHDVGIAFDGQKATYKFNFGKIDFWKMDVAQATSTSNIGVERTASVRNHSFYGAYYTGAFEKVKNFDLYYLIDQNLLAATTASKTNATGIRAKDKFDALDYRFEYTNQVVTSQEEHNSAFQYDLELGYTVNQFRFAYEKAHASEFYNQLYPTAHKWLGMADLFKRQNIKQDALYLTYNESQNLNIVFGYHLFSTDEKASSRHKWLYTANEDASESDLGNEMDLITQIKDGKLQIEIGYSIFTPGDRFKSANNSDSVKNSYIQLQVKY